MMNQWQIGDVTITRVVEIESLGALSSFCLMRLAMHVCLIVGCSRISWMNLAT